MTNSAIRVSGINLLVARHAGPSTEAIAGLLFLFGGVIIPLEALPEFLRPIGYSLPVTYWMELVRRSLLSGTPQGFTTFNGMSTQTLILILSGATMAICVLSILAFSRLLKKWSLFYNLLLKLLDLPQEAPIYADLLGKSVQFQIVLKLLKNFN